MNHRSPFAPLMLLLLVFACGEPKATTDSEEEMPVESAGQVGLHHAASFPIGGAINIRKVMRDSQLRAIVQTEFNSITSTNDMKMYRIAGDPGPLDFSRADSVVAFAKANDLRVFGHALVWHYALPDHIANLSAKEMGPFLDEYVTTVVTRYKDDIDGWDVVNEVLDTKGGEMRNSPFHQKMGREYIDIAFRAARKADPDAKLFINDFGTERDTAKLSGLLQLVADLQDDQVPIDGIGFQWHLQMRDDTAVIRNNLRRAVATGLLIHVSELDLIFNTHNDERGGGEDDVQFVTPMMLDDQAQMFETVARIYREEVPPAQRYGITFWDFTDRDTWIKGFFDMGDWPTIFDDSLNRKPGYYGFEYGIREQ
ncbi:endo-1,4-beta-xylanase [Lewinella sp. 4G2]|uniref:endo-1,4-beta-xylanase n=1 Tax=Lewinella sp. 4G2 TaxID=1803372 RepID=UPI0007DF34B9|nr:endo-1,4-beta-xylanase [Lewinella sp. 4G2]OAV44104.1 hypothetical protein A3850_006145 [Lewinella sp. 4G2]